MHHMILMAVLQRQSQLPKYLFDLCFIQLLKELVAVLSHIHMLRIGDYIELLIVHVHIYELYHIRMV